MPVETFTAFVVEQTVAIAIGVVAIAAAPKVMKETQKIRAEGDAAVGQAVYGQIMTAPHWYAQQWQTLLAEAQAAHRVADSRDEPENLWAMLAGATAVSDIRGRVRLRLPAIHHNERRAAAYRQALAGMPGISHTHVNATSGRILIHYQPARYPSLEALREAFLAAATGGFMGSSAPR
jgi:competence protein ComGC